MIGPATMLALVGDPGAGAGHVARIIAGIARPESGRVLLDGVDTTRLPQSVLRATVGYVSPETGLFEGSVRDNLRLGRPAASDDDLLGVLASLFGDDLRRHLPAGLDTGVGLDGRRLSAGTLGVLAIARAMVREPAVLVLDRITDPFDPETLARLLRARTSAFPDVTLVVCTSQPHVAQAADDVVHFEPGLDRGRDH